MHNTTSKAVSCQVTYHMQTLEKPQKALGRLVDL